MASTYDLAPVDLIVVRFPHADFHGEIAEALGALIESGTITVLDLVLVAKDEAGDVAVIELEELASDSPLSPLIDGEHDLLNTDDIAEVAASLEPGSAAAAVLWENSWANQLSAAIANSGGEIVSFDRIPSEAVAAALAAAADA